MIVNIEQRHIDNGKPGNPEQCPIALWLFEQTGHHYFVGDDCVYTRFDNPLCNLPVVAQDFVRCFDDDVPVKPFSFTLPDSILTS